MQRSSRSKKKSQGCFTRRARETCCVCACNLPSIRECEFCNTNTCVCVCAALFCLDFLICHRGEFGGCARDQRAYKKFQTSYFFVVLRFGKNKLRAWMNACDIWNVSSACLSAHALHSLNRVIIIYVYSI